MIAKQIAEDYVQRFMNIKPIKMGDYSRIYQPTAKECALIVVDELLEYAKAHGFIGFIELYNEVKTEIENL